MLDRMSKRLSVTHYGFGSTAASPEERSFMLVHLLFQITQHGLTMFMGHDGIAISK
jgi:hypothetical protein